jgi:hypothetical protein
VSTVCLERGWGLLVLAWLIGVLAGYLWGEYRRARFLRRLHAALQRQEDQ